MNHKLNNRCKELEEMIKALEARLDGRINDLDARFKELEVNTYWKLKDVENLLQIRVNEKFVWDALKTLEDRLRKDLGGVNDSVLENLEKQMIALQKMIKQVDHDCNNHINKVKDSLKDVEHKVKHKNDEKDFLVLKNEVELLKGQLDFDGINY